jgi:hypothetical protein
MTSGRSRKLKILDLQSPCKLIPLIHVRMHTHTHTHTHTHISCRNYWHFPPPYLIPWLSIWGLWTGSKKQLNAAIGDLRLAAQLRHRTSHSASWTSNYAFPFV